LQVRGGDNGLGKEWLAGR